jgi:hypothetical protein
MPRALKLILCAAAWLAPLAAGAAPGGQLASFTILPTDIDKVVAAYDKYYASSAGKQFKGRATLAMNVADGADPSTYSLLVLFHSQAEQETYTNAVMNDPARKELLAAVVPVAHLVFTGRSRAIRQWGDPSDTDVVWMTITLNITDLAAFNAALDAWLASPTGKKFPGQGHLLMVTAAGANAPGYVVELGYASFAEQEAWADPLPNDPNYKTFQAAIAKVSTRLGTYVSRDVKSWGPASMKSFAP